MASVYTEKMLEFLQKGYRRMTSCALAEAFNQRFRQNKSHSAIHSVCMTHGFFSGRKGYMKGTRLMFTKEQIAFIKKFYRKFHPEHVAEGLNECFNVNFTVGQVRSFAHNHGIRSGRDCRFHKGHKPWNAGTKGKGICKGNSGNFKKGSIPPNRKPLWSERTDPDGYIWIKVPQRDPHTGFPTRYMLKHAWIWEQANGKPPKGSNIIFKDGNKQNCALENLDCVPDAVLAELNHRQKFGAAPARLKPSIIALAKLRVKTNSLTRRKKGR
jgi:hypothetical protein